MLAEWSNAESTRLGNATIPQSAFPCHWDHDPSAGPISINECLLKANATRLHIEDYHTQAEDFNTASNDKFEAMCGAYLAPHPWGEYSDTKPIILTLSFQPNSTSWVRHNQWVSSHARTRRAA